MLGEVDDLGDRVLRPAAGPVAVARRVEAALEDRLQDELEGIWTTLSRRAGRPNRRLRPSRFGITRSRTGSGLNSPALSSLRSSVRSRPTPSSLLDVGASLAVDPGRPRPSVAAHPRPRHGERGGVADQVPQIAEHALGILRCPFVQLYAGSRVPALRPLRDRRAAHRCSLAAYSRPSVPRVRWSPSPSGRLSRPRSTTASPPRPSDRGPCACPGPGSPVGTAGALPPSTGRQARRPAILRWHRRAQPQHATRPVRPIT